MERAVHQAYDAQLVAESPACAAFFVFSRAEVSARTDEVVARFAAA